MELLRSTGKALSQRTSQRHPHSKGIDDALRPGALPRPASESNPDRPPGRPTAQLGACLPSMCACCMQWRVHEQMSCYHTSHKLVYADDGSDEEKCIDQALVFFFFSNGDYATVHNHTCTAHDRSSEGFWVPTSIGIG
jgi:hypothetical protein